MNDWLDLGEKPRRTTAPRISTPKIRNEAKRGKAVQKRIGQKARSWTSDGQYVWYRPKLANPAIKQRLADQIARGELRHITTSDDVQIFEVLPTSPFHRTEQDFTRDNLPTVVRKAVLGACKHDWTTFLDALEEIALRFKNARYSDGKPADEKFCKQLYEEKVAYIFKLIELRRGPSMFVIDQEIAALRQRRGAGNGSRIALPPAAQIIR